MAFDPKRFHHIHGEGGKIPALDQNVALYDPFTFAVIADDDLDKYAVPPGAPISPPGRSQEEVE